MKTLADVKKGDIVVVQDPNHADGRTTVASAGAVWITAARERFRRSDGFSESGYARKISTTDQWDEEQRVRRLHVELESFGFKQYRLPGDKLAAVVEALRPILGPPPAQEDLAIRGCGAPLKGQEAT